MATTVLKFLTQPADTRQGYTIVPSSPYGTSVGIQVGLYDSNGVLQVNDLTPISMAAEGTILSNTYNYPSVIPVRGVATFSNLAINAVDYGPFNLIAGGIGPTFLSNTFNVAPNYRINPAEINGTIAPGSMVFGPYRYRGGHRMRSVRVSASGGGVGDKFNIFVVEPGMPLGIVNNEVPALVNYTTPPLTQPFSIVLDSEEFGGQCDIYVVGTVVTAPSAIKMQRSNG